MNDSDERWDKLHAFADALLSRGDFKFHAWLDACRVANISFNRPPLTDTEVRLLCDDLGPRTHQWD